LYSSQQAQYRRKRPLESENMTRPSDYVKDQNIRFCRMLAEENDPSRAQAIVDMLQRNCRLVVASVIKAPGAEHIWNRQKEVKEQIEREKSEILERLFAAYIEKVEECKETKLLLSQARQKIACFILYPCPAEAPPPPAPPAPPAQAPPAAQAPAPAPAAPPLTTARYRQLQQEFATLRLENANELERLTIVWNLLPAEQRIECADFFPTLFPPALEASLPCTTPTRMLRASANSEYEPSKTEQKSSCQKSRKEEVVVRDVIEISDSDAEVSDSNGGDCVFENN
jgi:hypothetical protein